MKCIPEYIERRIHFLLTEAQSERVAGQDIKLMMRVISNFTTIGRDGSSRTVYKLNSNLSKAAKECLDNCLSFEHWIGDVKAGLERRVMNEHQYSLDDLWIDIQNNHANLSVSDVWKKFCDYPMVTILVDEDRRLSRKKGLHPKKRYEDVGIEVIKLETGALEYWRSLQHR